MMLRLVLLVVRIVILIAAHALGLVMIHVSAVRRHRVEEAGGKGDCWEFNLTASLNYIAWSTEKKGRMVMDVKKTWQKQGYQV